MANIKSNSLSPNDPRRDFVFEKAGLGSEAESDHARSLELEKSLSHQLDGGAFEKIKTIVNNVVLGPQRTERTEAEMAKEMGKTREEISELADSQNQKTDEQAVNEVLAQVETLGIKEVDAERLVSQLREYVILVNKLNSAR